MDKQVEALVVGGGAVGVCTAFFLAQQGMQVTLLEKQELASGSSHGNAGLVAYNHAIPLAGPGVLGQGLRWLADPESPFYIKPRPSVELARWLLQFQACCNERAVRAIIPPLLEIGRASHALYTELIDEYNLDCNYEHKGRLYLYRTAAMLRKGEHKAQLLAEHGVPSELLDAGAAQRMEPNLQPDVIGGVYYPLYAHITPGKFVHALAAVAGGLGVNIHTQTEVLALESSAGRIARVVTTRGDFLPQHVVMATGAWSPEWSRQLKLRLPIQPAKGYSFTVRRPAACPNMSLSLEEAQIAVTPMGSEMRFSSTLELGGMDLSINQRRTDAMRRALSRYMRGMENLEVLELWRGLRPLTPDSLPIIGRSPQHTNVVLATGHGMLGITHAPMTGRLAAQLVAGSQPAMNLRPFQVERFQ